MHQIHQELVVGRRIVLSIDLSIAGESALGLETEVPLREFFFVLGGNLGAFGAGPTMDMSPFRMFRSCGSSSRRTALYFVKMVAVFCFNGCRELTFFVYAKELPAEDCPTLTFFPLRGFHPLPLARSFSKGLLAPD